MAPRAYWKGYLKLSLVSCPISLFPATSGREKISFHQLNRNTGNRIKYRKVDAETGDEVEASDIIKGYEVEKGEYIELEPEELEAVALDSKRSIEIEEFVARTEIDNLYLAEPYYVVPDGEVGQQAFAVIREAIRKEGMVAIGKVVFTSREHMIALEPRGKGMMGVTLRYPYEVRKPDEYFDEIEDEKVPKDMLDLAIHIVETKQGKFRAGKIPGRIRGRSEGAFAQKAEGREDRAAQGADPVQYHQSDGCAAQKRARRTRRRQHRRRRFGKAQPSAKGEPTRAGKAPRQRASAQGRMTRSASAGLLASSAPNRFSLAALERDDLRADSGALAQGGAKIDGNAVLFQQIGERFVGEFLKRHHPVARQ